MGGHGADLEPGLYWVRWGRYPFVLAKIATFAIVAYGVWFVLAAIDDVLVPVLLALFLAYLLDPFVDWFESRRYSRTIGILLCLVAGVASVAVFVLFLYPTVAHIVRRIGEGGPQMLEMLETRALPWVEANLGWQAPESIEDALDEYGAALSGQIPGMLRTVSAALGGVWTRTSAIIAGVLNAVLVPIFTFFFLRDFDRMRLAAQHYLPEHNREWVLERIRRVDGVVGAWFRGQIQVAALIGLLYAVGLGITFGITGVGVTSGIAIGLVSGLLNIVPYFGFLVGFVLSVLLALLDWNGGMPLLGVMITYAIVQALEGYVITPRIVGEKVGLSPVVVIISLLIGGELLGLLGVLLALPIAGAIGVLLPDLVESYRRSDLYTGRVAGRAAPPPSPPP